jgi:hypothetical protein
MAEQEDDKDVSRRYRDLGPAEPPPALDAKIRAEARSALETHAAPLVPPTGRRRWYFPVAAAAVIMLAVAVTSQLEREQQLQETIATPPQAKQEVPEKKQRKAEEAKPQRPAEVGSLAKETQPRPFADAPKDSVPAEPAAGARSRDDFTRENRARQERPAAAPPAAPPAAAEAQPQRNVQSGNMQSDAVAGAIARSKVAEEAPEAWLERIARLRTEARHDEADRALAEFRKRYPDYKIPPAMLEKIERK